MSANAYFVLKKSRSRSTFCKGFSVPLAAASAKSGEIKRKVIICGSLISSLILNVSDTTFL